MKSDGRRSFLKKIGGLSAFMSISPFLEKLYAAELNDALNSTAQLSPVDAAQDEDFWKVIRHAYTTSASLINLNNGGVSPQPKVVQDAFERFNRMSNEAPSYYMWKTLDHGREAIRDKLAHLGGCTPEEIAINRNTTEALETVIFGLNLEKGDEIVVTKYDYPNMLNSWRQREKRDGVVLKFIDFELPLEDEDEIVELFVSAFTPKTKIVHITHVINWTGQILPAKKIAAAAHARGIEVIVDGAHSFGHFEFDIPDLGCDYFGTSLHKWLCAPFGTGMLYVKRDKIAKMWTLFANDDPQSDNIRKFEALGTRSFPTEQAIGHAIDFHHMIGSKRKEERLRYLKNYWAEKVAVLPNVKLNTSLDPKFSCGIGNFSIEGISPNEVSRKLFERDRIHTVAINWENVHGVRVTPHVYTLIYDLDKLVNRIQEIAG